MKILTWNSATKEEKALALNRNSSESQEELTNNVSGIIARVRRDGDAAISYYTELFDGVKLMPRNSEDELSNDVKNAIETAYKNIRDFHELQLPKTLRLNKNGIDAWKEYKAIERVGLYIPGGTAPLVSTLLMLAIPAVIAECREIIVVTPPNKNGEINPAIIYAAKLCGINKIFAVGGAQAIAALAYGTETIPKVIKIFGPGNKYVTEAKLQVAQDPFGAALDMPAGPSEVLVIADDRANAQLVAADLLSQAEHDVDSKVILITTSQSLASQVDEALTAQLKNLQRQKIITKSLEKAAIIIVDSLDEAFAISNIFAPEHLILQIDNPRNYLNFVQNAGSVFIGKWSAEALGDYASGPNHVLPTYGYAKSYSGLGVESFMKSITFQEVSKEGLIALAPTVETLAQLEGLDAHKTAVNLRRKMIEENL